MPAREQTSTKNMGDPARIRELHQARFGVDADVFTAPGRVNLIGEHTDYSEGFVMPAAIDFSTDVACSPRTDGRVSMYSENFGEQVEYSLDELVSGHRHHWSDYPGGVVWSLQKEGIQPSGFNMSITGNVPVGAGLSSSASIEVAVAFALLAQNKTALPLARIAQLCQRAENGFVGANSGIMDQFVICCGAQDHALMLDCRSLEYRLAPIPHDVRLIICNTMVQHSVAGGEYNTRRAEIEEGVRILQRHRPEIKFLRDATTHDLDRWGSEMPDNVFRRCRHVVTEDERVVEAAEAFSRSDLKRFGQLMAEAHRSYRDDFEASCHECDIMVDLAEKQPGCYGARLTGGGFGGCTINLVQDTHAEAFISNMRRAYQDATGIEAAIYNCRASAGAHAL